MSAPKTLYDKIVKALMDSGWTKPPGNVSPLKVAKVESVTDDLAEDLSLIHI